MKFETTGMEKMKKKLLTFLCLAGTLGVLTACSYNVQEASQGPDGHDIAYEAPAGNGGSQEAGNAAGPMIGMPNPFIDCASLEEAQKEAGFEMESPIFDDLTDRSYQAIRGEMIQIFNRGVGAPGEGGILVRKARGNEDISGDYNQYPVNDEITMGDRKVLARGEEDGYKAVTWTEGIPEELLQVYVPMIR